MEKNIGCCLLAVLVPKVSIFDACACQYRLCALEMLLVVIFHHRHLKELEGLLRISGTPCIVWQNKFLQIKSNQSSQIFLLTFKKSHPENLQHFSPTNLPPMLLAPPVEVSNGYQSPPSLPSVFPLPQPCSKVFLLRSFHSLVVSLPTRWAWYVDDPIEIPRTRWRSFAAIPRETIWPWFPGPSPGDD